MTLEEAFATYPELYRVMVDDVECIFRPLTRREFKILLQSCQDGFDFEEGVATFCLVFPEGYDLENCKAGFPARLCLSILDVSGFVNAERSFGLIDQARMNLETDLDEQIETVIMTAFPHYGAEDAQGWTRSKFFEMFAKAEWSLALRGVKIFMQSPEEAQEQSIPPLPPPPRA